MFDEQDRQYFYNEFKNNGYEVGSYDDFKKDLNNEEDRNWYYNEAKNMGYDVGTQADFDKMVLEPAPSTSGGKQVDASATTQSVEQKASTETKPQVAQPAKKQETTEKQPGLISQALGMIPEVLKPTELSEKHQQRARELPFAKRQETLANKQMDASLASPNAPVETIAGAMGVAGKQVADPINQWSAAYENYYGKEGVDPFQSVVQDIMSTGAGDEDPNVPVQMAYQALERFADRTAKAHTQALVANLPEGVSIDEGIENQWYSHDVQDKLQAEAKKMGISYDDYVALFLKPSLVQSLKQKIPSMKESDAEGIALRLFSHEDDMENRLFDKDIADMLGKYMDEPIDNAIAKADNEAKTSLNDAVARANDNAGPLRQDELLKGIFASDKLKDPERVKENLQGQIEDILTNTDITLDLVKLMDKKGLSYDKLDEVMQKRVYPAVMNVLESKLSDKYIQKYMPKGSLEYIVKSAINNTIAGKLYRKMTQSDYQNWLEDMAYQQYQPGFWERVGSGALTFAGDAWSYWVPGLAGGKLTKSIISRAEASLTRDLVSRGVAGQTAARLARIIVNRSKARMLGTGAVNGAVTFGGQQVISTPVDEGYRSGQFDENGNVYHTNVGKVVRTTAKNATRESLMGAVLQGGTVANMIGKGRGLAANILADVGGKAFDSALMTGSGILEQKMADPSYQVTGKGVAENFLESGANLLAISFPHIVRKYVNFKDAQAFNKAAGFNKDDIATMKKAGYGDLHSALEKLATVNPEYRTEGWMERELANAYADPSIKFGAGKNVEDKTAYLTDEYKNFLKDKAVPQTLKIKLQSVIEGKVPNRLPAIIDSRIVSTDDGKVNLETYDVDGNIVTRQVFDSKEKADEANNQITLQKDLNAISLSENLYEANVIRDKIQQLYNDAQEKYAMGKPLSDEEKSAVYLYQQANHVTSLRSKLADVRSLTPEEQRVSLNDNDRRFIETYEKMLGEFKGNQDSELSDYIHNFETSLGLKRGSTHRALEGHTKEEADRIVALNKSNARNSEFKNGVTYHSLYEPDGKDGETTFIPIGNGRYRTVMEQRIVDAYRNQLLNDVGIRTEMRETEKEISNPNEEVESIPEQVSPVNSSLATENTEAETTQPQGGANISPEVAPQEEQPTPSGDDTASADGTSSGQESPVSSEPAPYQDRTNSVPTPNNAEFAANPANVSNSSAEGASPETKVAGSDAFVMGQNAYKNGDKEGLKSIKYNAETAELRLKRAFANDTDRIQGVYNAVNKGTDIETYIEQRTNYLTPFQQEAIRKYAEAMDAKKGAMDALEHADDGYADKLKQQLSQYTMENGNISSLTLTDGQRGYWKSKNEYGAGFGVFPDANGQPVVKQVPSSQVKENGKEIPLQEYVNQLATQKHEATKKNFNAIFDATSLKPNDTVSLSINDKDQPTEAKIVSVNPDGTISFNIAGSKNVTTVPVDTFTKFQKYALRNSINAELDAEDAERAEKEAIKVEAEKKQRFANGIVGLSEQKPDYSSKETDPKVAAEYLQEQYADNHDQLIKLVNGSRSDIKEQIDNIRKRIVEAEDWLDTNADLEPEQAQSREDKLKLAKEQLEDLTTRYDNWNKIRSLIMTEKEKREIKDERTANIKKVGIDKEALTVTDEREVPVLTDEELKKQYPTMDEASDYILSQRKEISKTQEELHRQLEDIDDRLNQYLLGESDLTDEEIRDFNTTKADLEARMANLSASAKDLIAQNDSLKKLYKLENQKAREEALNDMSPAEQRRVKAEQYLNDRNISGLAKLYSDTSVDFMDDHPYTVDEYVASSIGRHALNYEGREVNGTFLNGLQQEFGGTRKDLEKIQVLAAEGKGQTFDKYVNGLYDNLPDNLRNQGVNTQEIRNSLLALLRGAEKYTDLKNYILKEKIAQAEGEMRSMDLAEEEQRAVYEEEHAFDVANSLSSKIGQSLSKNEADGLVGEMEKRAEPARELELTPENWLAEFGENGKVVTPLGDAKMGENQLAKLFMKGREAELGLIKPTLSDPDVIIEEASHATNSKEERPSSYLFVKTFERDGKKIKFYASVSVKKDGMEVIISNHFMSKNAVDKKMQEGKMLYIKGASTSNSSDSHLAEHQNGVPDLLPTQEVDALNSVGKDTNNSDNLQGKNKKFSEKLQNAIAETETKPTEAQKKAGNYKKGHLSFGGYDFTVETPKGVTRSGKDEQGKPWSVTMHDTYGYILGKIGVDGDHIDMFINDAADLDTFDGNVYVVDQVNPETGEFDEHKVMYGYPSEEAATEAYLANYSKDWKGLGKVTSVPKATFDKWLESSDRKTKPFAEYAMIQQEEAKKAKQTNEVLPFDAPMSMDDLPFHRDVKEVKPENMTEAQKVAYDAVSTMLKKAGIPVKVVSNEDMEKVAEAQDNLAVEMLLNDPRLRFYIKTPEQKEAAKAAYDWAAKNRPDKFKQYAIVNMDNPNQPPQYFEKKDLDEKWRKYYTNAWKIGNYKAFNLNKPFEEQIKDVKGDVPNEFDPYKAESLLNKRIELEKQIKETEDSYNAKKKERAEYQNQLMQDYMDQHGLSSENDIPDDVWTDYRDKSFEKYQDTLDDLFHKYVELDNQLKAVAEPGVQYLKGKGVVYGYTDGKEIVLNQEHLNPNTPIHEYQHLWRTAAKKMNPELIEHGDKLIMQTQLFADLKQDPNYNHLTDEQICDEAFARLTGEDGAAILEQMAKDAIKENPLDTAKELSVINKLKEWLKKFWFWTLDTFTKWKPEDIKKMTLEDIRNLVLRDLANGVDPRTKLREAENADDIKFMGSTTKKRMKNVASQFEGRDLDKAQQVVADVYSGKDNNRDFSFTSGGTERIMVMRQGNDEHAGTKHSLYRHFGVSKNYITIDDILSLPKILNVSTRKPSKKGTIEYSYTDKESGVTYTVVTKPVGNKEHFQNFYSDRKANPSDASHVAEGNTYTPEGARKTDGNAFMRAKVDNNSETAKENGGNLSVEDKIKAVSQQFGVDEADVAMYANGVKKGSTAEAARARANIKRHLLQANEDKISSFKELLKYTVPVNEALKENFGDVDAMIEERKQQMEAQRNAMEAARKRAEEEEAKRKKHLEDLSLIPDDKLDKQYMDALAKGDDATAREMLDEAARRKGYDDTESAYQGVGAWAAPGNPGYESDKARRDDWESSGSDVNLEDMALGYTPQPDDYFSHPERYSQNTPHGLESVKAINTAIDAIKNGEKDVKVKVYRAVPTSVKEGKLRNGDWVTPSKKYAEMHGTNRLEGKYRIIEDEVPANQLWWDGNDANEFGFDDGKEYKYKNVKNNRKLNDLVTYDDEGDVIPPSKRFNSRKQDVRFHRSDGANLPSEEDNKPKKKTERGRIDEATGAFKLAPNGEQSNLSKKQYIEARTKNFKDWFGGDWEKKPKDFKNKLDANGEPLEKYVEGYLNRPKKPTMPKKRKGEDEATFFGRKMLYSQALEDWPKTEADWKKRIDEFDENTLAALTPPDEEAIREKYQKQYENDMASWRKDHPKIKEGEERPLKIPDMRDYQSIQDYGEAMGKYEIWKTAPHKDEYDRMAEDEIISKVALMDAVQHPFSEYARLKAMKAEFQHMRHVMQNQKVYDKNTTDAVVQFAKRFMSLGYGDDLGRGSINTLLTIVKNSTGKKSYEISQHLYQVMDVLMNNQLRNFDRAVMKTMSIKELKENAKGIQVQGKLELRGQTTIKAFRDAVSSRISSDKLDEKISNLIDKMAADKKNASSYQDELLGLNLAKQYVDYIDSSRNDAIEIEDMKRMEIEGYKNRKGIYEGELTKALLQEHVERLNQYDDALFNNKVERMERYSQLLANLGGMIDESVKGAREFQERDARRAIKVKMMASADLGDKSMNQHHKENWKTRLSNSDVARLFCSPLGSFDALMREFGSKQINGEGQLWNHFVRGAMKASNDAFKSVREANNEIDLKVSELFGKVTEDKNGNKKGNMTLNDLYALERSNKVKSLNVTIRDIEGEQTYKLQQGNLMYIYMVNKMPDGAMKLREMRILDADVERIKKNIDPRFLKLADWIQGEFLPKMRTKYNKRHEELFGAPMPMVENYFPLRVLKNARYMEEDVNNTSDGSNALPSTATGAIIKRKTNKLPLDILNADALSVTIDNIKEMENWYNYAPIRKDANTLLSDTTFRNRVQNMTTIYGSGERLWNNVKDATAVAMGTYRPKGGTDLAVSLKNMGKGITGAKISFRLYTAFKQVLSAPLFLPDVDPGRFAWYSVHPYGSFKWAIENLPNFDKRWSGRKLGDTVLMDDPTDWKLWHTNLMEKAAYYGMTPNALVDAVTCAVGARAVYDTKYKQYIKYGLTEERAKEKALSDAEINFNTSQQSSEGAFVSPMQLDRTLESAIFTPFRNSSMLYERKGINALRNLKHRFEKGHKEASIKFMAGQLMEEGVGYEQATKAAEKMYQKGLMHNIANAIVALWLGPIIWNLGGNLGYLMFGDDNEKKKKMVIDAVILGLLEGPVDGLAGGQFINTAIANTITSDGISLKGLKNVDFSGMPMLSDFNSMIEKFGYDKVAGVQDLMFMVMQSSTGFNPKTLTDAINACIDYGNGDMTNAKEIALFVFRLMNGPAATVDNLYIDELGMKGKDAKKLSYEELAKRYAEYKFGKNAFGLGKLYSDEEKQKKLKAIEKSFDKKVSERLAGMDREDLKNEFSESRSQKEKKLIGKIIADELGTKDSEAVKKAKADASYLRQRNFSDLMDDLYLQKEWEATNEANAGLEELKGNGASEKEIEAYKTKHKAALDKRKAIQKARKEMQKKKADISSDNDEATMAAIRKLRDSILKTVRQTKSSPEEGMS